MPTANCSPSSRDIVTPLHKPWLLILGLVLVALGMGLYLAAATLNQALLAHGLAAQASASWLAAAAAFVAFLLLAEFDDRVLQVELAFTGAAAALSAALFLLYRRA